MEKLNKQMNKSFTLIEILVVIVVIGILSAFILVGMSSIINSANVARSKAFLDSANNSLLLSRVSQWKLDGNYNDSWGGKTATPVNSPTVDPSCAQDSCYAFNGSSQYAWIADDPVFNFGTKMSAFVWAKGVSGQNDKSVFAQYDYGSSRMSWLIDTHWDSPMNKPIFVIDSLGDSSARKLYASTAVAFDNNWHLIGFTWNSGILKLYVDGNETGKTIYDDASFTTMHDSNANVTIGARLSSGSPTNYFAGSIDDARLYSQPIPTVQIQQNYYLGLNKLFENQKVTLEEYNQRITELKSNLANNE
jgi:prepilin-type N-terminal cleavage/methylation domain-containing protein